MKKICLLLLGMIPATDDLVAQGASPTRTVTAYTLIDDEYYNGWEFDEDLQSLTTVEYEIWDEAVSAESSAGGSVTYADAGQWSWVDGDGEDFEAEGFAAGGLYNQLNGEMRAESLFRLDFAVPTTGAIDFAYDFWFGTSFGGLSGQDRTGQSLAEVVLVDSTGAELWSDYSTFENGGASDSDVVSLSAGVYSLLVRAEIRDETFFETVYGSMTVANFYIEGTIIGGVPLDPPADSTPPGAPTGLGALASDGSVALDWADNGEGDLAGYNVHRAITSGGPYTQLNAALLTESAFTDANASNGTTWFYVVTAVDTSANESANSGEVSATPTAPVTPTVLAYDDFETGFGNFTDGGRDCARYTGGTFAYEGNAAINIQDNSGVKSSFALTQGYDVDSAAYTEIEVDFHYVTNSMESGEDFWLQYFDGSSWHTVAAFVSGVDFANGQTRDATVVIAESNYTFPTNMKIRFMCDASNNGDDVYIDASTVTARWTTERDARAPRVP